jgi:hypothetical protein
VARSQTQTNYRYPLFVDPEVQINDYHGSNWRGWGTVATPYNPTPNTRNYYGASAANCAYYCGLYLSMPTNTAYSWNGTSIYWQYRAIANTYIYAGTFGGMGHIPSTPYAAYGAGYQTHPWVFSRWFNGIFNGAFTTWEANTNYLNQGGAYGPNPFGPSWGGASGITHAFCLTAPGPRCDRENTPPSDHNALILGLNAKNDTNQNDINTLGSRASVTMAWANTYLNDRHNPWISSPRPADKDWTDDSATATHQVGTVRAQDAGLGVNRITLTGAADGTKTVTASCSGDPQRAPCPLDWPMDLPSYRLDEGVNTLGLQNTDIVDNVGDAQTWTEKIDRTAPTITDVGGPLRDAAGGTVRRGSYDLHVDASDGVPGGTVRQRRSGGKQIIVRVSDAAGERTARSAVRSCPIDSCELHENVTVPAEVLGGPGEKTISVTATDQLNHESDPAAQRFLLTVDDGLGERAQYTFVDEEVSPRLRVGVNVANGNLLIRETDYEIRETGIDIAQRRYYNSQATGTGAYGAGWSALGRDMRVATLSDGSVRLEDSTGYHAVFSRQTDGSFTAPRGTDAEIQRIGDAYRLGFRASEETLDFPLNGPMQRQTDSTGEAISFTYAADGSLSSVRHSDGAEVGTAANADGRTASAQTPAGQHTYVYDGPTLVRHTDPVLGATSYTYDSSTGLLRVVDSVDGHADITYDANDRVKTLTTRRGPSGQPTQTVTFDYPSAEMATATLVDGATTTYTVDHNAFVTLSRSGTNPPAVELGGSLKDRDGTLLGGEHNVRA